MGSFDARKFGHRFNVCYITRMQLWRSTSKALHQQVIFILSCAVLLMQFLGLQHGIHHGMPQLVSTALAPHSNVSFLSSTGFNAVVASINDASDPPSASHHANHGAHPQADHQTVSDPRYPSPNSHSESVFTTNHPSDNPPSHNCLAWNACSLASALFLSSPILNVLSLLDVLNAAPSHQSFQTKPTLAYLSRAPPYTI